jgi:type VI secretion system FHA domain protein
MPAGYNPLAPDTALVESVAPPPMRPRSGADSPPAREQDAGTPLADLPAGRRLAVPGIRSAQVTPQAALPPPPVPSGGSPAPGEEELAELLTGAGLPSGAMTPELARNFGAILRIVVSGLMDVLQSRQRIKEEFRMDPTMFRRADNNPLKFSVNVEDALHNLLVKRNAAYLGPVEAFADAFDDLRDHQLAVLAGMRVAFDAMLAEFAPDHLQAEFDRQVSKASFSIASVKSRYWELYRDRARDMAKDPEATFGRLFGEEFRQAYEEQFRELKAQRRNRKRDQPPNERPLQE